MDKNISWMVEVQAEAEEQEAEEQGKKEQKNQKGKRLLWILRTIMYTYMVVKYVQDFLNSFW